MAARVIVSLSGAVGSGKSTTARAMVELLRAQGQPAEHVRFQDFVAFRLRTERRRAPRPERPGNGGPVSRSEGTRRHDYRLRPLTLSVTAGYLLRSILFRVALRHWPNQTILVFDRYFYDSLVHFDLERAGLLLELLMLAIPPPSVGGLLLIPEQTLRDRRSYYSADYARLATIAYERLAARFVWLIAIRTSAGMPLADARKLVNKLLEQRPNDASV